MTTRQWLKNDEGEDVYVYLSRVLNAIPSAEGLAWRFRPMSDPVEGFEANGVAASEVESSARNGKPVSTERAARALRSTQVVWGVLHGSPIGSGAPTVTIEAIDTTTYRIEADQEVIASIASAIDWSPSG